MICDKDKFDAIREEVDKETATIVTFMKEILDIYSAELDELVEELDVILQAIHSGDITKYTDSQLEYYSMKLPVLMYRASGRLEELGAGSDVAKANRKRLFNSLTLRMKKDAGTVAEKKAMAESMVENEQVLEDMYSRVYNQLKIKIEYADGVFTSIKKVISKRMLDLEVFRKDLGEDNDLDTTVDNSIQDEDGWKQYKSK